MMRAGGTDDMPMLAGLLGESRDSARNQIDALRTLLNEVEFGVVLLDTELRATYINKAFRKMWRLPDAKADARPAFVALMYHGRDTGAYEVAAGELDAYVAERVAHIKSGNPAPRDLRLRDGRVLRLQCAVLPGGGRMLSYTYITDIVRHSDELEILHVALDNVSEGVMILDSQLRLQFINRAALSVWRFDLQRLGPNPTFPEMVREARWTGVHDVSPEELDHYIAVRIAIVKSGDAHPHDLRTTDGRVMRAKCTVLPGGGRMITYTDVTDLAAVKLEVEAPGIAYV